MTRLPERGAPRQVCKPAQLYKADRGPHGSMKPRATVRRRHRAGRRGRVPEVSMQVPVQVTFHQVTASDRIKRYAEQKAEALGRIFNRITGCRVTIEPAGGR